MKNILFTLALLISFVSFGQDYKGIQMCLALQSNGYSSNTEAEEALDLIMNVSGLNKNFILAPCDNIENAYAIRFNNERYIIYDKDFMDAIGGDLKWGNLTILAHEVAHHLNNHPLEIRLGNSTDRKSFAEKRRQELEADEFAGFIMARLDAPLNEVLAAISSISDDRDDTYSTHPSIDKRVNAIKEGYKRAGYRESISYLDRFKKWWFNKNEELNPNEEILPKKTNEISEKTHTINFQNMSFEDRKENASEYYDRGLKKFKQKKYNESILEFSFIDNNIPSPNGHETMAKYHIALNLYNLGKVSDACEIWVKIQNKFNKNNFFRKVCN
jgi:TolA-binding protein